VVVSLGTIFTDVATTRHMETMTGDFDTGGIATGGIVTGGLLSSTVVIGRPGAML